MNGVGACVFLKNFQLPVKWVLLVVEKELVVAERAHRDADLAEVVEVAQARRLAQHDPMVDLVGDEVGCRQVRNVTGLAAGESRWMVKERARCLQTVGSF
jgi:hypothetical protein